LVFRLRNRVPVATLRRFGDWFGQMPQSARLLALFDHSFPLRFLQDFMSEQSTNAVVMVRPCQFYPNPETALDNAFQSPVENTISPNVRQEAEAEFDRAVEALSAAGIRVHVFADTPSPAKPDAVFPNNWFSTHEDGRVALYPMYNPSRRPERRRDLIECLGQTYEVSEVIDYSDFEKRALYLEGTGSLVLDQIEHVAYASLSKRTAREPLEKFCADFHFRPLTFESTAADGRLIYHTNVMMCVGTAFALVGLEMIKDPKDRVKVRQQLEESGRTVIELTRDQVENFAGNALELHNNKERLLVLSARAAAHLEGAQIATLQKFVRLLPLSLPTIELAGGSARCMMATIHLPHR